MTKSKAERTKEGLIFNAFIQFSLKPYDQVTFDDLVTVCGLSRGTILYHFKTKKEIFEAVIELALQSRSSILDIPIKEEDCLKNFILDFIKGCQKMMKIMAKQGIINMNLAHFNIENQALYYYENYDKLSKQAEKTELKVWTQVVRRAFEKNEIKNNLNVEVVATLFYNAYLGHAYCSVKNEKGCDIKELTNELISLYDILKA